MSNCNHLTNPLKHDGTSQSQRLLPGMDKNKFALVDEKDYADWIVFANEFAAYINYYNTSNKIDSNWQVFFSGDVSAKLGVIAIQDIERYRIEIKERLDFIRDDQNQSSLNEVRIKLNELFSAILTFSWALDESMVKLPEETRLKNGVQNLIRTKLAPALKKLIAYHKAAETLSYLDHSFLSPLKILNKPLTDAEQIINNEGLGNDWLYDTDKSTWNDYLGTISPDDTIFAHDTLPGFNIDYLPLEHAANHNLFTGIFDTYLSCFAKIINDAETELLKTLESDDAHSPHYALFLSFLKLFRFAQIHINTLTQSHLDFYYKEVLKLQPKPAVANQVHVLGELANQVDDYLLAAGTALKAGKDSLNNEVSYTLNADAVINKAKVTQLKTFYKGNQNDKIYFPGKTTVKQTNDGCVFASPVTNSDDGLGAELTSPLKEWHPFVHKVYQEGQLVNIAMPKAQIGFALASHYFYLTEGEREVFVRLSMNNNSALTGKKIECWLTTAKGWYKVESYNISSAGKTLSDFSPCSEIAFTIPGSAPATAIYNKAVHGGTFDCALPILKIYLQNNENADYEYDLLRDITISKIEIMVKVGMDNVYNQNGLKNLVLFNDFGVLDASKPFLPFGSLPNKDNGFIIGHQEIFSKKNASVNLNIEWADLPGDAADINYHNTSYSSQLDTTTHKYTYSKDSSATPTYPTVQPVFLQSGKWIDLAGNPPSSIAEQNLFDGINKNVRLFATNQPIPDLSVFDFNNTSYLFNAESINGFMQLVLKNDFGHSKYITDLSTYLVEKSKSDVYEKTVGVEPTQPYTPKIKSLYANYSAYCTNDITDSSKFGTREINFFHIYPFGEGEQHKYLQPDTAVYLLPQFKHLGTGGSDPNTGEFYIGIEQLKPGESVNILFQVLEGTTDPELAKPEAHIQWSFLGNNQWIAFEPGEYSDRTLDLVQSGIISFAIPKNATTENSILPTGFIWIRAAVTRAAEAVCKLLAVDAQAAVATFADHNNADDFLNNPLAAGTISKLKSPDAAIKKIMQPYPSFGGRQKESSDHFYLRVSERLRHKSRAITVWDYEHLVLEAFPEIYKVKCLNHTQIEDGIYNEVKPGHVSIITIPSLQNRNDANPLKPYTQQSTLTNIENYLNKKVSCFVNLHVCQPQFEEVRMQFKLKLLPSYKDFTFYSNLLTREITKFLSPWAFGNSTSIDFGGKVYKSVLINFIEERYYVDFITDVFMYVKVDHLSDESGDKDEITASTSRSILVSAPASKHKIEKTTDETVSLSEPCPEN